MPNPEETPLSPPDFSSKDILIEGGMAGGEPEKTAPTPAPDAGKEKGKAPEKEKRQEKKKTAKRSATGGAPAAPGAPAATPPAPKEEPVRRPEPAVRRAAEAPAPEEVAAVVHKERAKQEDLITRFASAPARTAAETTKKGIELLGALRESLLTQAETVERSGETSSARSQYDGLGDALQRLTRLRDEGREVTRDAFIFTVRSVIPPPFAPRSEPTPAMPRGRETPRAPETGEAPRAPEGAEARELTAEELLALPAETLRAVLGALTVRTLSEAITDMPESVVEKVRGALPPEKLREYKKEVALQLFNTDVVVKKALKEFSKAVRAAQENK